MTLLTSCNQVLRETGFPDVTTVVGNTNQAVRALLSQAQREGKQMAKKRWSILTKRNVFTTVSGIESYALPSDFYSFIEGTEWNTSNAWPMAPTSDEDWQENKSGLVNTDITDRYQVRADGNSNRFFIDPIPSAAENISFFYISDSWCQSSGGARQNELKADTDVILLDTDVFELGLKWRFLRAQRRDFQTEYLEYMGELNKAFAVDGGSPMLTITGSNTDSFNPGANVGETGFGS